MSIAEIRTAIVDRLRTAPGIGQVHDHEPYVKQMAGLKKLYTTGRLLSGGYVKRVGKTESQASSLHNYRVDRWRIAYYFALSDDGKSELVFDGLIEAMCAAFRLDETIGGAVETTNVDGAIGLQLDDSGPVMFADVLCHGARLSLRTQSVVDLTEEPLDAFLQAHIDYDLAPIDGTIDATDDAYPDQEEDS